MSTDRRQFLIASIGLLVAGCEQANRVARMPGVAWPDVHGSPRTDKSGTARQTSATTIVGAGTAASPITRAAWARYGPNVRNINLMRGVRRITIHHEGFPDPIWITDQQATAEHLELVRRSHRNRGWADIGYHYIIDRAGRVWEGRPLQYQGAHVKNHNEHNLGIMMLGNFNKQQPTDAQLASLRETVQHLRRTHHVRQSAIHTHRELGPTTCPGNHLQPRVDTMRRSNQFA